MKIISLLLVCVTIAACGGGSTSDGGDTPVTPAPTVTPTPTPTITTAPTSAPTPTPDPLVWPITDGIYGSADTVFTLPTPKPDGGLYLPDIQTSYPEVDWQNLDRLYIPAGHYKFLRVGNLPERTEDDPLIITNYGGQVRVGGLDHYYLFVISGGSNWILTGRYDPVSATGDENYPGHRGGNFANSQDSYGIMVDDDFVRDGVSGLGVSGATEFEVEFLEIKEVEFAGMTMKTDDNGDAHMVGVKLHDNYIHDTGSEGLYIGSTQSQPQHQIRNWEIYNNRIIRTGTEAIQLGQLAGENLIYNNVFGPAAIDWRAAFQKYQDNNFQLGIREGHVRVYNNIFIGSAGSSISFFAADIEGDSTENNVGVTFTDNYFEAMRNLGMYINNVSLTGMEYRFENNVFGGYKFERDEVYVNDVPYNHLLRIANNTTPIKLINNTWTGPDNLTNFTENNGVNGNLEASGNNNTETTRFTFVDSGLPDNFDYLNIEMWTDYATLGSDQTVIYEQDEIVMHNGIAYQCTVETCVYSKEPPVSPDVWQPLPAFADDVRVVPGSEWDHLGPNPNY